MTDTQDSGSKRIETKVVDPEAPVRFIHLFVDGEEAALIPWDEAEAIADQVGQYEDTETDQNE